MIRVTYLILGSGLIFYCWRLVSQEMAMSFQICISFETQPSHNTTRPQITDWTELLTAINRIFNDLNLGRAWPMIRVYHRVAHRLVGGLSNDIYVPRINTGDNRGRMYSIAVAVTVQSLSNIRPRSLQLNSGTRALTGTRLGSQEFSTWNLSDPLDHSTPPNTPTDLSLVAEHPF